MELSSLPERLTVSRSFTYDIAAMRADWTELNAGEEPTDEDLLEFVRECYSEDLTSPLSRHEITLVDPDTGDEF